MVRKASPRNRVKKVTTEVRSVSTTHLAQLLAVVVNERQNDRGAHLPHVEFAYNNEIHIGDIPRLPRSVFDCPTRDRQIEAPGIARRRALNLVPGYNALMTSRVERNNPSLLDAINELPSVICWWLCLGLQHYCHATVRQGADKDTIIIVGQVRKAKFSLSWTGPYKALPLVLPLPRIPQTTAC